MNIYLTDEQIINCSSRRNVANTSADNAVRIVMKAIEEDGQKMGNIECDNGFLPRFWAFPYETYEALKKLTRL